MKNIKAKIVTLRLKNILKNWLYSHWPFNCFSIPILKLYIYLTIKFMYRYSLILMVLM
jgi:hypothetical protein